MNPADLQRRDSLPQLDSTPPLASKTLPGLSSSQKNGRAAGVPRIDTEPIYTQLKAATGEHWGDYKVALSAFMLGSLNQVELTRTLSHFLSHAPSVASAVNPASTPLTSTLHLHNTLVAALYANIYRDPPPELIAPWVLATDAPSASHGLGKTSSGVAGAGDKAEERLKREVMALSVRDRRRVKNVKDAGEVEGGGLHEMQEYRTALEVRAQPEVAATAGAATSGLSKTNWDLEIRRRFAMSLASETLEFPSKGDIQARIEPICYEEGVVGGVASGSLVHCAELVEAATEVYMKELLAKWFAVARTNGEGLVQTARFKKTLRKEEAAFDRGEVQKTQAGYLPVEADVMARRRPMAMDDIRLALRLDSNRLPQDPFLAETILGDCFADMEMDEIAPTDVNGALPLLDLHVNGVKTDRATTEDAMAIDDIEWGWSGGHSSDRDVLMGVLDGVLSVGS